MWYRVCKISDIPDPASKGFTLEHDGKEYELFLVKKSGQLFAYINRCPHTGVGLNWQPDQFLDIDAEWIQCAMHGALFRIENGVCVRGPCAGESLQPVSIRQQDGDISIKIT